jgi:hypothetical protein
MYAATIDRQEAVRAAENAYREARARVARRNTHAARAARVEARIALMALGVPDPAELDDPQD